MFSHGFGNLIIGQLKATLEGLPVDVCIRVNIFKGEKTLWQDSSSDDYLHRSNSLRFYRLLCMSDVYVFQEDINIQERSIKAK